MNENKTSLGGDAVRLTTSKLITMTISMVVTMLLSRFRTLEEYGTYSQILLVINLFSAIFMLGLPNSINYFLARADSQEERKRFLSVYYTLSTLLTFLMGAVLVLALPIIEAYFKNPLISGFAYFLAIYPWAYITTTSIENTLVVYHRTKMLMIYRVLTSLCLLGAVILVQALGLGFSDYMVLTIVVYSVLAIAVYIITARFCGGLKPGLDRKLLKSIFAFSLPIGLSSVVGTLSLEIDKLMIGYLMDTEELAIYTNAAKELPFAFIASSITAVLLPQIARLLKKGNREGAVQLWGSATKLAFIVVSLLVIGVVVYAEDVMTFLYSEKYLPGVSVFRVYTLVLLLRSVYFGMILNCSGKTKSILYCSIASLVINALLNPLFYLIFGMIGPAVATFVSILVMGIVQFILTSRVLNIPLKKIFPWGDLGKILLFNILLGACFGMIKHIVPLERLLKTAIGFSESWGSLVESLIFGAIWAFIYLMFMRREIKASWQELNRGGENN